MGALTNEQKRTLARMARRALEMDPEADQVTADLYQGFLESLTEGKVLAAEARAGLELVLKRM